MWAEGSRLIEEGNHLWKEVAALPGSVRIGIWFSLSETSAEAASTVSAGYTLRMAADALWHDAVMENKGPKTKVAWIYDNQAKGYDCILDSGEAFKA